MRRVPVAERSSALSVSAISGLGEPSGTLCRSAVEVNDAIDLDFRLKTLDSLATRRRVCVAHAHTAVE